MPGHLACDSASRSEILVSLIAPHGLLGVFDLDSPKPARSDEEDARGIERLAAEFLAARAAP